MTAELTSQQDSSVDESEAIRQQSLEDDAKQTAIVAANQMGSSVRQAVVIRTNTDAYNYGTPRFKTLSERRQFIGTLTNELRLRTNEVIADLEGSL